MWAVKTNHKNILWSNIYFSPKGISSDTKIQSPSLWRRGKWYFALCQWDSWYMNYNGHVVTNLWVRKRNGEFGSNQCKDSSYLRLAKNQVIKKIIHTNINFSLTGEGSDKTFEVDMPLKSIYSKHKSILTL